MIAAPWDSSWELSALQIWLVIFPVVFVIACVVWLIDKVRGR
jgi:hypothetical protein